MRLPKSNKIVAEKYVAGLSQFKDKTVNIKLSANESALGPSPKAIVEYLKLSKSFKRYPDTDGVNLRKTLAKKFKLDPNKIILGSGSDQIFELICKAFLKKGDEVITVSNTAIPTISAIISSGATPVLVDANIDDYLINPNLIEEKITLEELKKENIIISLGGGAIMNSKIKKSILLNSVSFWLDLDIKTLEKRLKKSKKRRLLNEKNLGNSLKQIYKERKNTYAAAN